MKSVKVHKVGHSLKLTLPSQIAEFLGIKEGSVVELTPYTNNQILMTVKA